MREYVPIYSISGYLTNKPVRSGVGTQTVTFLVRSIDARTYILGGLNRWRYEDYSLYYN